MKVESRPRRLWYHTCCGVFSEKNYPPKAGPKDFRKGKEEKEEKRKGGGETRRPSHRRHHSPASPPPSPRPTRENKALAAQRRPALYLLLVAARSGALLPRRRTVPPDVRRARSSAASVVRCVRWCTSVVRCIQRASASGDADCLLCVSRPASAMVRTAHSSRRGIFAIIIDRHRRMISSASRRAHGARRTAHGVFSRRVIFDNRGTDTRRFAACNCWEYARCISSWTGRSILARNYAIIAILLGGDLGRWRALVHVHAASHKVLRSRDERGAAVPEKKCG